MHITIDVNIKGLEGLLSLINHVKSSEQGTPAHTGTVVPMPTSAQAAAAPVLTGAAAPQLSVVSAAAPVAYPTAAPAPVQMQAAVPTAAPQVYTEQQLAVAATQLMDAGRQPDLIALLTSFGVQALTQLPKEQYGNFATQLRAMGARI